MTQLDPVWILQATAALMGWVVIGFGGRALIHRADERRRGR